MTVMRWWHLKVVLNLANLSTPLGMLLGVLGGARLHRGPRGLVLGSGYRLRVPIARAFTVGNVVLTRHDLSLFERHPALLVHEERHTWQYAALLGTPFVPLYLLAMAWSLLRGGDLGTHNVFERLAGLEDGGYPTVSARARRRHGRGQRRTRGS